jgi:hypothetical protein
MSSSPRSVASRAARRAVGIAVLAAGVAALGACDRHAGERASESTSTYRSDGAVESRPATWSCTASPCPWGPSLTSQVAIWPLAMQPKAARLGYTTTPPVYAPAEVVEGAKLTVRSGTVTVYAGAPGAETHRLLAAVSAGQTLEITGLTAGEVVSVQSESAFVYHLALPGSRPSSPPDAGPPPDAGLADAPPIDAPRDAAPADAARDGGTADAEPGKLVHSIRALWKCHNTPGCFSDPWTGAVIAWPEGTAHQGNGRTGNVLRFTHALDGTPLYSYMGAWAEGCEITAETAGVVVVEWKWGASEWRETVLNAHETRVIHLVPPEDGALIEAKEGTQDFSVTLRNCHPKPIQE